MLSLSQYNTQRNLVVVTDVSGQPIELMFKGEQSTRNFGKAETSVTGRLRTRCWS